MANSSGPEPAPSIDDDFKIVKTTVATYLVGRIDRVHHRREIGAFAGPPGLGKTIAIGLFKKKFPHDVVVVTPRQQNMSVGSALRLTVNAIRLRNRAQPIEGGMTRDRLQIALDRAIKVWADERYDATGQQSVPFLTLIFDEAQRFTEDVFETLRAWNDAAWSDHLPQLALVFIGNAKFILEAGNEGPSFLTDAVKSRTAYWKSFAYSDLLDDDLRLASEENGLEDEDAVRTLLEFCADNPRNRDLRVVARIVGEAKRHAAGCVVAREHVRRAIGSE